MPASKTKPVDSAPTNAVRAPARRRRISNVERAAQTRKELLEATIQCLFKFGYGATTTHLVAEVAGLSRGAMSHHYANKAALMVEAVKYAWRKEQEAMDTALAAAPPGLDRFRTMIRTHWDIVRMPEDIAINEVRIGSRSDPALAQAVQPIMADIAASYGRYVGAHIREAGLEPNEDLRGLTVTWALALPMMAVYRAAHPNARMEESLLATLEHLQESFIERQTGGAASPKAR